MKKRNVRDPDEAAVRLAEMLRTLRMDRRKLMRDLRTRGRPARLALPARLRAEVLAKTDGRCHICGGAVEQDWHADHVLAHASGGRHQADNYLAAHALCNNYRWHYLPEEFQYVMKIGVWARLQIEKCTPLGREIAHGFSRYERRREKRRVSAA